MRVTEKFSFALAIATALLVSNLYKAIWLGLCSYVFVVGWFFNVWG